MTASTSTSPSVDFTGMHALIEAATQQERQHAASISGPTSLDLSTTDTLEPHVLTVLLTDDLLPIGNRQTGSGSELPDTGYIRQISSDRSKPRYAIFTNKTQKRMNARPEQEQFALVKATLSLLTPPPSEEFLVDLFIRTHNSAFPVIIPPPDFHHLKLPLLRKMYLTALSHCREYRPSARAARRVDLAGSLDKGQESTRLSSISAALLDLSGRPVLDAEYRYILLARTIAQSQLLGLHIDCTNWALPPWEKDLRRVLWWDLRIHDAWMSFLNSRPAHIQGDNHSVPFPALSSAVATSGPTSQSIRSPKSFVYLCRLSYLVSVLQARVCTLSSELVSREDRLRMVMEIEVDVGTLLHEVRSDEAQAIPSDVPPSGVASLMTCLLGFRCMLRRISIELKIGLGSPFTPDPETLEMFRECVDYFCSLTSPCFDGFWLVYVGHVLSSLTSSLIRLSLATTSSPLATSTNGIATLQANMHNNPILLLHRLVTALRTAKQNDFWDLAEAALTRAESVAMVLRSAEEFTSVVAALESRLDVNFHLQGDVGGGPGGVEDSVQGGVGWGAPTAWNINLNAFGPDWESFLMGLDGDNGSVFGIPHFEAQG